MEGGDPDAIRRFFEEKLRPGGRLIGEKFGRNKTIRKLDLEEHDPEKFFDEIARHGMRIGKPGLEAFVEIEGVGTIGYRTVSKSGHTTIDVTIPGIGIKEIKFV